MVLSLQRKQGKRSTSLVADGGVVSQPQTVLVADDDDGLREMLRLRLEDDEQWEVQEAVNGMEVLDKLDGTVDILVLDRQMPELTGPEVIERLDETPFEGAVIVLSAYQPDQQLSDHDRAGGGALDVSRRTVSSYLGTLVEV